MELLLPTDGCPNCISVDNAARVHPHRVRKDTKGSGIFAYYRCPVCRLSWMTGWSADAAELPCPGCPACDSQAGAA